ncbi:MAG: hypothetical protein JRF02_10045 [Deltaproteobacteria bacterium]|jgi:hypothetical protein|nr:hypothetical protein [Deltaproteobacteria bacterium]
MSTPRLKLFVHKDNIIKLRCPNCLEKKEIPASVLKNKYKLKGRCRCGAFIEADIEYRRSYRKETNLAGYYSYDLEELERVKMLNGEIIVNLKLKNCNIINISTYGLRLKNLIPHEIKVDDVFHLIFQLSSGTVIENKIIVRNVHDDQAGCEFIDGYGTDIGLLI